MEAIQQEKCVQTPRAERIAQLNDNLRREGKGGRVVITQGIRALPGYGAAALLSALRDYDSFDADNDPHGERDFGLIEFAGAEAIWKIDYFDASLRWGSDDPADPAVTQRVLTIMLVEEY